ncbi:MAG TPA: efflux RND transporter periplasmic adaptor subunit [Bacteroidia bacterium]
MKFKYIVVIALLVFLTACSSENKPIANTTHENEPQLVELTEAQFANAKVKLGELQVTEMSDIIKVSGKIDVPPQNMVSISAPLGGFLKTTKLLPGLHLKKGELIATMEDQAYIQLQQDYLSVKAEIEYSESEYARQKKLNETKAGSNKELEASKSNYTKQIVQVNALAEKLRMLGVDPSSLKAENISGTISLRSPIDGYVSKVNVNVGKYIHPTEVMFELVNPEDIHLNMTVFEKDVQSLRIGQKVITYSNANPSVLYPCEIILIGQDVSKDRHVEVHCHFEKYDRSLIPGMYMNAEIKTEIKSVSALPEQALVSFGGKDYIFVETTKLHFEMVEVSKGVSNGNLVEIKSTDKLKNSRIVIEGAYALLMKLKNGEDGGEHAH